MFESLTQPWWAYVLVGLVCGIFGATFGVGSGIIMIPTLILLFSVPQKSAQGICLAVMVPMALVSAIKYWQHPEIPVDLSVVLLLAIGGVVGAWIGSNLAAWMSAFTLRRLFAVIMILAAVKMLTTRPPLPRSADSGKAAAALDTREPEL